MNSFLTGNKDVDNLILEQLKDKELLELCLVNKYANYLCNNDAFWKKRFIEKFGKGNLKYNSSNINWKKFYLSILSFPNLSNLPHLSSTEKETMIQDVRNFFQGKQNKKQNGQQNINDMDYIIVNLPKGFIVNHERWSNKRFEQDFRTFKLFWTSPGDKSYYGGNLLKYRFILTKAMSGIKLTSSASDFEKQVKNTATYDLPNVDDAFRHLWYGILEKDLLGFNVDFINLYDEEIIFSSKNLKYLVEV